MESNEQPQVVQRQLHQKHAARQRERAASNANRHETKQTSTDHGGNDAHNGVTLAHDSTGQ